MKNNYIITTLICVLFIPFLFNSCNNSQYVKKNNATKDATLIDSSKSNTKKNTLNFDKVVLEYNCAALPPNYYRNYTIEVAHKKGNIKIVDYAKELDSKNFKVKKKEWNKIVSLIDSLEKEGVKVTEGAAGTHSHTIILYEKDKKIYTFSWDSLSEINQPTKDFQQLIIALVKPSVKQLVDNTIK